jgi:SAM-dependent methyltransferase
MSGETAADNARQIYRERDVAHWRELESVLRDGAIPLSEALINFPAFIRRRDMTRLLADYDLFRLIVDLPGSIAELGVYLGAGIFTWAKLLETFVPGDRSRRVYGFESSAGYGALRAEDGNPCPWIDQVVGLKKVPPGYLDRMVRLTNLDNMISGAERVRVIQGDILQTVPEFVRNAQGTRFSLIYLDVNLYEPTLVSLRELFPLLLPGGVLASNGFGSPPWQGETVAIEQYFKEAGLQPVLRKFPYSIHPSGYFIKE